MVISSVQRGRVGSVEVLATVPADMAQTFLPVYRAAFAPLELRAPARQSLTDDEFLEAMGDETVLKFVGWNEDRKPCAMAIMATDISVLPWVSVPYFKARFPGHYERRAIYYFCALLVRPEDHGGPWARLLIEELTKAVATNHAIAAFDCCAYTVDVTRLPEMLERVGHRLCFLDPIELDPQRYFAFVTQGLR